MRKRRPEIMKPGRKLLTPYERSILSKTKRKIAEMWEYLFSPERNKWRAIK